MNYYNEFDPYVAEWLRNLITDKLIPAGDVDSRSIVDVQPKDLNGYTQCHFFAGVGGWSKALEIARWPIDRPVWTGSCPCQPFSVAGKQKGTADSRHLWPELLRLISQSKRRPPVVFGEQVAAAFEWLAGVRGDLEGVGYAVGAVPVEAACAGEPQYRDRYWFVARRNYKQLRDERYVPIVSAQRSLQEENTKWQRIRDDVSKPSKVSVGELASSGRVGRQRGKGAENRADHARENAGWDKGDDGIACGGQDGVGELARQRLPRNPSDGWGEGWTESEFRSRGFTAAVASLPDGSQFIGCPDGKFRRLPPPRVRWLGNGIPSRVAQLRALGNAIVPQVAAQLIKAYMETEMREYK